MSRTTSPSIAFEPYPADRPARRRRCATATRNGHDWAERYSTIASAIVGCAAHPDGEVAIVDLDGRAVFERLQEGPRIKPEAVLFAFDLIEIDGEDLRREPLLSRKSTLLSLGPARFQRFT